MDRSRQHRRVGAPTPIAAVLAALTLDWRAVEGPAVSERGAGASALERDRGKAGETSAAPNLRELAEQLREDKPERRRAAVRGLVRLSTPDSWRLVFEALADRDSGVADEAQLSIAGVLDPKLRGELLGRAGLGSKDDLVALRVAEALGRSKADMTGDELAKLLGNARGDLARTLVASVERLARAGRITGSPERLRTALLRAASAGADDELSCAALLASVELAVQPGGGAAELGAGAGGGSGAGGGVGRDPGREFATRVHRLALEGLRQSEPERRVAALAALVRLRAPDALAAAVKLSSDEDASVRLGALDALEALGTRASFAALVARLGAESRLRLRWRIVDQLQTVSGMKHRLDPRPWKLWIETLPESGVVPRPLRPKEGSGAPTTRTGFSGLPLISDRVCYLFDFSGSMWTALADGRIPKDIVSDKLRAALEALPPDTEFNLIPFTNTPIPWREQAQPANTKNLRAALEFFLACRERGKGNFLDAALLAASDPRIDTICVLTDGVPTGGTHSDMDLITHILVERTRFRRVVVDSILVDAPPAAVRRWAELSRLTGGRSIEVELKPAGEGSK